MEMLGENTYLLHDETKQAVLIDCGVLHPQEKQAITDYVTATNCKSLKRGKHMSL